MTFQTDNGKKHYHAHTKYYYFVLLDHIVTELDKRTPNWREEFGLNDYHCTWNKE